MAKFVIGDIHGNYKALVQCFERSGFNPLVDQLICLGDVVDGYPETKECIELLSSVKDFILINSNHDQWYLDWLRTGVQAYLWVSQGGQATLKSVNHTFNQQHLDFFNSAVPYYIDDQTNLFVHGGIEIGVPLKNQSVNDLMWNRQMIEYAWNCEQTKSCTIPKKLQGHAKYFIGHTTTEQYGSLLPLKLCNVWALDTGAGFDGKLTIMNVNTEEYWQSDDGGGLYGVNQGRP